MIPRETLRTKGENGYFQNFKQIKSEKGLKLSFRKLYLKIFQFQCSKLRSLNIPPLGGSGEDGGGGRGVHRCLYSAIWAPMASIGTYIKGSMGTYIGLYRHLCGQLAEV